MKTNYIFILLILLGLLTYTSGCTQIGLIAQVPGDFTSQIGQVNQNTGVCKSEQFKNNPLLFCPETTTSIPTNTTSGSGGK